MSDTKFILRNHNYWAVRKPDRWFYERKELMPYVLCVFPMTIWRLYSVTRNELLWAHCICIWCSECRPISSPIVVFFAYGVYNKAAFLVTRILCVINFPHAFEWHIVFPWPNWVLSLGMSEKIWLFGYEMLKRFCGKNTKKNTKNARTRALSQPNPVRLQISDILLIDDCN